MTTSPWLTTDQVAAHYQLPVATIRQRIPTGSSSTSRGGGRHD